MTLTDRRVAQVLLDFAIKRGEIAQARRNIEFLKEGYEELEDAARQADRALSSQSNRLAAIANVTRSQAIPSTDELRDSIEGLADAQERLDKTGGERTGGFRGIQRLGRLAGNVPGLEALQGGLNIADDVGDAVEALGKLSPVALAVSVGVTAAAVSFAILETRLSSTKEALDSAIASVTFYYQQARNLTTEQNRAQLAELQQSLQAQRDEQQRLFESFNEVWDENTIHGSALQVAIERLSSTDDAAAKRVQELNTEIGTTEGQIAALERALQDGSAATNDATQAEQELAAARQQLIDALAGTQLRTLLTATSQSTEGIQQRLGAINLERQAVQELLQSNQLSAEATDQYRQRLQELSVEEQTLAGRVAPLVAAREAELAAIKDQQEKEEFLARTRQQAGEDAAKAVLDIAKLEDEITDIQGKMDAKLVEIAANFAEKAADLIQQRDEAITSAEADAADARAEAVRRAAEDREKLEADHIAALQRIDRQYFRDREQAIQDRNAVALDAAETAHDDQTKEENDNYKRQRKEIDKQLQETNRQIDKRLREQTALAVKRYNEQYQAAYQAAVKARALEVQRFQQEIADKQAQANILHQQLLQYNATQLGIAKDGATQLIATHRAMWQQLLSDAGGSLASGKPVAGAGGTGGPILPPKFASGGYITRGGLAVVHPKEVILNERQQRDMGGINMPITIDRSMTDQQIENKVVLTLRAALRQARAG